MDISCRLSFCIIRLYAIYPPNVNAHTVNNWGRTRLPLHPQLFMHCSESATAYNLIPRTGSHRLSWSANSTMKASVPLLAPTILYLPSELWKHPSTVVIRDRYGKVQGLARLVTHRPTTVLTKGASGGLCARVPQWILQCLATSASPPHSSYNLDEVGLSVRQNAGPRLETGTRRARPHP